MSEDTISMESERRLVTVMFADICGFTAMSEKLDPEELSEIMNECFRLMGECIERHGGSIDKFMGDCVMALFGARRALEDAPHRAIDTALELRNSIQVFNRERNLPHPLDIHIGINTGPVIAGMMGSDTRQDFTVMGDTVNLASRLADAAGPGTVVAAENTCRLTAGYFAFEPLGEIQVKGREHPVLACRVLGTRQVKTRVDACLYKGLTPFVGRSPEIGQLAECLDEVEQCHGQVVGVVGEPGVGKSRLVCEFRGALPPNEYLCLEGGCLHYGEAIAYLPVLDILKDYFEIREDDTEARIKAKINARIEALNTIPEDIEPPIHEVFSLPVEDETYRDLEPRVRRERIFEAIRLLLFAQSQAGPLIIVVEDLHWIDRTSEEFLSYLINFLPGARILLILLYRPEYTPAWVSKTYYTQVRVGQLQKKSSEELVRAILAGGEVAPELIDLIVERAAGNPLFMEELTCNLVENSLIVKEGNRYSLSGISQAIQVPETIQGIIAARLDRLEENLRQVVQVASVIGREFAYRVLENVTSLRAGLKTLLMNLQELELIYEKCIFPELEYIFKHALTQEVAYAGLLFKKRRELHGQVGRAIEQLYADRLEEFYEMLAYHYSLSSNQDKALKYLKRSADKAAKKFSNWEAVRLYREAVRIVDARPDTMENRQEKGELLENLAATLMVLGYPEGSREMLEDQEKLAREAGDDKSLATAYNMLGHYHTLKGDSVLAMEYMEKCFITAEKIEAIDVLAQCAMDVSVTCWFSGDYRKLAEITGKAIQLLEDKNRAKDLFIGGINVYSQLSGYCLMAHAWLGRLEKGKTLYEKGIQNASAIDDKFGIGFVEMGHAVLSYQEGDADSCLHHAAKSLDCFEKTGSPLMVGFGYLILSEGYYITGDYSQAQRHAEKSVELAESLSLPVTLTILYRDLALIYAAQRDFEKARKYITQAVELSRTYHQKGYEGKFLVSFGWILREEGMQHFDEAHEYILQGLTIAQELGLVSSEALAHLCLGELYTDAGMKEEALAHLKKSEAIFHEMNVTPKSCWLARAQEARKRMETL